MGFLFKRLSTTDQTMDEIIESVINGESLLEQIALLQETNRNQHNLLSSKREKSSSRNTIMAKQKKEVDRIESQLRHTRKEIKEKEEELQSQKEEVERLKKSLQLIREKTKDRRTQKYVCIVLNEDNEEEE